MVRVGVRVKVRDRVKVNVVIHFECYSCVGNGSHWTVDDPYMVDDVRQLLKGISRSSFATLKYVISFLAVLVQHAADNKMNSSALGTVFGPNIFRYVYEW
jgi:hypothetical protein